ncbi:MAG: MerR family transcriptional regulator [Acidobacteriota bacterium]|nr:MerR family transcriptional regulator [Acidobacteriota bacterium]
MYFRIGEVSKLLGVPPYVLRFWETAFPALAPKKTDAGHRLFRRKDVELLLEIKHLLYESRFTIEGARQALQSKKPGPLRFVEAQRQLFAEDPIPQIRQELEDLLALLSP